MFKKIFISILFIFFSGIYSISAQYYGLSKERVRFYINTPVENYINVLPDEIYADTSFEYSDFIYTSNLLSTDVAFEYFSYLYDQITNKFNDAYSFSYKIDYDAYYDFIYKIGEEAPVKYHFIMDKKTGEKTIRFYMTKYDLDKDGIAKKDENGDTIIKGLAIYHLSESEIKKLKEICEERFK